MHLSILVYVRDMRRCELLLVCALVACAGPACFGAATRPPWVSITSPLSGTNVSGIVPISVTATDDVRVASVRLKLDGADIGAPLTNAPFLYSLNAWILANGTHSLLATAMDTAGNSTRSSLVSITVSNPPAYALSPGPFVVQVYSNLLSVNAQERQNFFQLSNNVHLLLYYIADYGVSQLQILDVNLSRGTARLTNSGSLGRPGIWSAVLYTNGNIYQGTSEAGGKGYFFEYNPTTGATRQIAQLTGSNDQFNEIGDDGWIYIGGFPYGYVDRYNPNTDTFQSLGKIDKNSTMGTYAYTLGADSRYLYVGLGQSPWYLGVYDTHTSNSTFHFGTYTNGTDIFAAVRHGTNGGWYYQRAGPTTTNVMLWYALSNGVPNLMSSAPTDLFRSNAQRGNVVDDVNNGYLMGYQINMDYALPDSTSNSATIQWRTLGATNWQSLSITNLHLAPLGISRIYALNANQMLGFSSFYGPVMLYDTVALTGTKLGYPQCQPYDASVDANTYYFCGYTATTLRYNPSLPWTLVASTPNKYAANINPYQIPPSIGKHEYFTTFGSDGMVYVAAIHERNSAGGELGWYDPVTGTNGSLRDPFLIDEPADLKPALGGTKLVYASTSTNLFVLDAATKSIERIISPLGTNLITDGISGITYGLDKVVEVSPGIMLGVAGSNIFKVNITDGSVIYSNTLPGSAFQESQRIQNRRLVLGPDGHVWMFRWYRDATHSNKSSLYRINPADCSYTTVLTNTFYACGENNCMFNGGDLYLYGGTRLYRVRGVLNSVLRPPTELKVIGTTGQ